MGNIVDTVEDRIQKAILTRIDSITAPKIELAVRSLNASSGPDATGVTANSEREDRIGLLPLLKTYPKGITHYMCWIRMMKLEIIIRTR